MNAAITERTERVLSLDLSEREVNQILGVLRVDIFQWKDRDYKGRGGWSYSPLFDLCEVLEETLRTP